MKRNLGLADAILFFLAPVLVIAEPATLNITEASYTHKEGKAGRVPRRTWQSLTLSSERF